MLLRKHTFLQNPQDSDPILNSALSKLPDTAILGDLSVPVQYVNDVPIFSSVLNYFLI